MGGTGLPSEQNTGCRVHFFATPQTLGFLRHLVEQQNANAEYTELDDWEDLLLLTGQVNYDHLFVVVSARKGSISYQPSFEKLPLQISRYFANNSLMVIYPTSWATRRTSSASPNRTRRGPRRRTRR